MHFGIGSKRNDEGSDRVSESSAVNLLSGMAMVLPYAGSKEEEEAFLYLLRTVPMLTFEALFP